MCFLKNRNNSKREVVQWIGFGIVMLAFLLYLLLLVTGVARNLSVITLDGLNVIKWGVVGIGVVVILISYLIPKKK